jgi:integrase
MLRDMAAGGASTDSIRRARALLTRGIRRAQRDGLVHRNVAELAEMPRGTRRASKAMTLDQVRDLLALELTPFWRAYIVTALTCGLRPGELLGLRWRYVDFSQGIIRVRMCLKALPSADGYGKRVLTLAELKTDRSRRTLQMPRDAAAVLRALKAQQAKDRLRLGKCVHRQRSGVRHGVRRSAVAAGRPQAVREALSAGRYRGRMAPARDAPHLGYLYCVFGPRHGEIPVPPHRASQVSGTQRGTSEKASTCAFLSSLPLLTLRGSRASVPETAIYQGLLKIVYR